MRVYKERNFLFGACSLGSCSPSPLLIVLALWLTLIVRLSHGVM